MKHGDRVVGGLPNRRRYDLEQVARRRVPRPTKVVGKLLKGLPGIWRPGALAGHVVSCSTHAVREPRAALAVAIAHRQVEASVGQAPQVSDPLLRAPDRPRTDRYVAVMSID